MATANNLTYSGNKIAEDFHNTIYDISPTDTPLGEAPLSHVGETTRNSSKREAESSPTWLRGASPSRKSGR